ncbi:hypothetical protein DRQ09_06665 [candidate division KSB1 bacterium]|nr:MAG: hypothetical protein DRQ09_06665 [candidate division KSB1 bacterium]
MTSLKKKTYYLLKRVNKAISEFNLIEDGDRIAVAVSGGKDSLTLLRLLIQRQSYSKEKYKVGAVHIISDFKCKGCVHRITLENIFKSYNIDYGFEHINVLNDGKGNRIPPSCFWCSWNRRKAIFLWASKNNYNKVAFGHHQDDLLETVFLNLFFHSNLETMEPRVSFFNGEITVIRPLIYLKEKDIISFVKLTNFPSQLCSCPNASNSKRTFVKDFIKKIEPEIKHFRNNVWKASRKWVSLSKRD